MTGDSVSWWGSATPRWETSAAPAKIDVAVVGGGLAGLASTLGLVNHGINVALFEASNGIGAAGLGAAGIGVVEAGTPDLPSRSEGLFGREHAALVAEFSRANGLLVEEYAAQFARAGDDCSYSRRGSAHLSTDVSELAELRLSVPLSGDAAMGTRWRDLTDPEEIERLCGVVGFPGGVLRPADAMLNPHAFLQALARLCLARGAALTCDAEVRAIEIGASGGLTLHTTRGDVKAEMAVIAAGAASLRLVPLLRERIVAVSGQGMAMTGLASGTADAALPVAANFGHVRLRVARRGTGGSPALLIWCIPWSLAGSDPEASQASLIPDLQDRMEQYARRHVPCARNAVTSHRWAALIGYTMDNLPLAGPLPGSPRIICCTGFSGYAWGMALHAGLQVAAAIAGGRTGEAMELFSPRRFLA